MDKQKDKMYRLEIIKTIITKIAKTIITSLLDNPGVIATIIISLIIATNQIRNSNENHASQLSTELLFNTLELDTKISLTRTDPNLELEKYTKAGDPEGILTQDYIKSLYPLIVEFTNKAEIVAISAFDKDGKLKIPSSQYLRPYEQSICAAAGYIDSVNRRIEKHIKEIPGSEEEVKNLIIDSSLIPEIIDKNEDLEKKCYKFLLDS